MTTSDLRYPIGRRVQGNSFSSGTRAAAITDIEETPAILRRAVAGLTDSQLDTPYRPDGWTIRQVVHHVADAHMVLYTRARTAVTEDNPFVKTWDEERWAELPDAKVMAIDGSLSIIDARCRASTAQFLALVAPSCSPTAFRLASNHGCRTGSGRRRCGVDDRCGHW